MPKIKKAVNDENKCPNKMTIKKKPKQVFKFDINKVLKERQAANVLMKKNAQFDKEMKIVDDLFQEEVSQTIKKEDKHPAVIPILGCVIFDHSKYNVNFEDNYDKIESYSQKLLLMSIEENELEANIIFNNLMKSNWSPVFVVR